MTHGDSIIELMENILRFGELESVVINNVA